MSAPLVELLQTASNPKRLARQAARDPAFVETLLAGLGSETPLIKFGCAKALWLISAERPDLLYRRFDKFTSLLAHPNKILQWQAARVLSCLARVDSRNKFSRIFRRYFAPIPGPVMITAANVIQGGARIAQAKPQLADRIAAELQKVTNARYRTPECRNVAIGHAILALGNIFELLKHPTPAVRFVRQQLHNPRPATRKKAEEFLRQFSRRTNRRGTAQTPTPAERSASKLGTV